MPLLISPIDGSPMKQIHRYGIELDVCPTSGGIWLDKGELEKIMAIIREAAQEEASFSRPPSREPAQSHRQESFRRDDEDRRDGYRKDYDPRKKSSLAKMMDIFDF